MSRNLTARVAPEHIRQGTKLWIERFDDGEYVPSVSVGRKPLTDEDYRRQTLIQNFAVEVIRKSVYKQFNEPEFNKICNTEDQIEFYRNWQQWVEFDSRAMSAKKGLSEEDAKAAYNLCHIMFKHGPNGLSMRYPGRRIYIHTTNVCVKSPTSVLALEATGFKPLVKPLLIISPDAKWA